MPCCGRKRNYKRYYEQWIFDRCRLLDIAVNLGVSIPTLQKKFDDLPQVSRTKPPITNPVNLIIDATFFGREYGYLCFHDTKRIIHFHEIKTESLSELEAGLEALIMAGQQHVSISKLIVAFVSYSDALGAMKKFSTFKNGI